MAASKFHLGVLSDNFATANITQVIGLAEYTCSVLPFFVATEPYSSGYTFHEILLTTSAVTTVLTLIFTVSLISVHLANWVKPQEQKQIVRVIFFPTIFAFFNLYAVWFYKKSWILLPFPELYETFALVAMFYLLVVYVTPHESEREERFHHLARLHRYYHKGQLKHDRGSLRWFQVIWVCVFQVLPVKLIVNLLQWILSARWCPIVYSLSHTSLAIEIIESISTTITITSVILFAQRVAPELHAIKTTRTRQKLISFKGIVGVTLTQAPIFAGLATSGVFKRTIYVSTFDFIIGIPAFMTCCEMFLISVIFIWTFSATPYLDLMGSMPRCRGVGGALLDALDIRDILKGYWYMTKIVFTCGHTGTSHLEQKMGHDHDQDHAHQATVMDSQV